MDLGVLITRRALDRYRDVFAPLGEYCRFVQCDEHGTEGDAPVVAAWHSSDLHGTPAMPVFLRAATGSEHLAWLQTYVAGVQTRFFSDLLQRGVRLTASNASGVAMAEYVLRAVLDHFQQPQLWREAQAARRWEPHLFAEVSQSTWVVVGLGPVGIEICTRARALGAYVIGVRRSPSGDEPADEVVGPEALADVAEAADVLVLAAPANPSTVGMIDASVLSRMKARALLVNVARGALVDEDALLAALDEGRPAAAVLDVTRKEPLPPEHPLWTHPGVTITPHSSAYGRGVFDREADSFAQNLSRFIRGQPLADEIESIELVPEDMQ